MRKQNLVIENNQLLVCKGVNFHACQMTLDVGWLTYSLTFKEDKLLANKKQFKVISITKNPLSPYHIQVGFL